MVKLVEVLCNPIVAQDIRIIGKLWADDQVEDKEEEAREFTPVLSRSQKKSLKNKGISVKAHNTRNGGSLNSVQ
ncbi:hypothetical protein Lalb_Chr09g0334151 [Lupinus albus]|uniref:Uncharacterized protein n=1 Tax=Lupinus albus TaxID=3870 RepID=A0A6A4Q160_LUPAL|nr:hypothetical protein Lalb_Chr09g0334151 [Lupinus albus]